MPNTISDHLNAARSHIGEAVKLADNNRESFTFSVGDVEAVYYPKKPMTKKQALKLLTSRDELTDEQRKIIATVLNSEDDPFDGQEGWVSSY